MRTRDERFIRARLEESRVARLNTPLDERAAFRVLFAYGGGLRQLSADRVSNIGAAINNASRCTTRFCRSSRPPGALSRRRRNDPAPGRALS